MKKANQKWKHTASQAVRARCSVAVSRAASIKVCRKSSALCAINIFRDERLRATSLNVNLWRWLRIVSRGLRFQYQGALRTLRVRERRADQVNHTFSKSKKKSTVPSKMEFLSQVPARRAARILWSNLLRSVTTSSQMTPAANGRHAQEMIENPMSKRDNNPLRPILSFSIQMIKRIRTRRNHKHPLSRYPHLPRSRRMRRPTSHTR